MNYEEYDKQCEKIRSENNELLKIFKADLEEKGLTERTIRKHMSNLDLFLNDFLLYMDFFTYIEGVSYVDDFLGDFYIRKCAWSTPGNIKTTAASIKKFYKIMLDHGQLEKSDYKYVCDTIKQLMPHWQESCAKYNASLEDDEFDLMDFWGLM